MPPPRTFGYCQRPPSPPIDGSGSVHGSGPAVVMTASDSDERQAVVPESGSRPRCIQWPNAWGKAITDRQRNRRGRAAIHGITGGRGKALTEARSPREPSPQPENTSTRTTGRIAYVDNRCP